MRRIARAAAVVLVLGGTAMLAWASSAQQPAPGAGPSDVDITFRQRANLTPQEMLEQGRKDMQSIQNALKRVQQLQELARKQNDIIKLNCVNDKVVQIRAVLNIAETSMGELNEAIG